MSPAILTHKAGIAREEILMFEYKTKSFNVTDGTDWISDWLNSLYKGGFGVKVVGYVCVQDSGYAKIIVTVLRWKIQERTDGGKQMPSILSTLRTTIDEIPEEPSINYEGMDV